LNPNPNMREKSTSQVHNSRKLEPDELVWHRVASVGDLGDGRVMTVTAGGT